MGLKLLDKQGYGCKLRYSGWIELDAVLVFHGQDGLQMAKGIPPLNAARREIGRYPIRRYIEQVRDDAAQRFRDGS